MTRDTLPILGQLALNRGLISRSDLHELLARQARDPSLKLHESLAECPGIDSATVRGLIDSFLKDDQRFSTLVQSLGLVSRRQQESAVQQQRELADKGVLVRVSSIFERQGVKVEIGGYRLSECLGSGAMGAVFTGVHTASRDRVAVKIIRPDLVTDDIYLKRFLREARALEAIKHRNVVRYHGSGQDKHGVYLACELIEGQDLKELVKSRGRLDPEEAATIMAEVFAGLAAIHEQGIVHRDLKPDNVLVARDGTPKIADFGLARRVEGEESLAVTNAGALLGTPSYMSPEQCMGDEAGPEADLYTMGAMFFHLVVGKPPFAGRKLHALIEAHVSTAPPDPRDSGCPDELASLILELLAKDPADRPSSAAVAARRLEAILGGGKRVDLKAMLENTPSGTSMTEIEASPDAPDSASEPASAAASRSADSEPSMVTVGSAGSKPAPRKAAFPRVSGLLSLVGLIATAVLVLMVQIQEPPLELPPLSDMRQYAEEALKVKARWGADFPMRNAAEQQRIFALLAGEPGYKPMLAGVIGRGREDFVEVEGRRIVAKLVDELRVLNETGVEDLRVALKDPPPARLAERDFVRLMGRYGSLPEPQFNPRNLKAPAVLLGAVAKGEVISAGEHPFSLRSEALRAIHAFRWRYRRALAAGDHRTAAELAWNYYARYGNLSGHALEVLLAFSGAVGKGELDRSQFRLPDAGLPPAELKEELPILVVAWVGPLEHNKARLILAVAAVAALATSWFLVRVLVLLLIGLWGFLRTGLWVQIALLRGRPSDAARACARSGDYARAASLFQEAGDPLSAAEAFEKADQLSNAASAYERAGRPESATRLFVKLGNPVRGAEIQLKSEQWDKAAELFVQAGERSRAAEALEKGGQFVRAAKLLEQDNRHRASADMLAREVERLESRVRSGGSTAAVRDRSLEVAEAYVRADQPLSAADYYERAERFEEAAQQYLKADRKREAVDAYLAGGHRRDAIKLLKQMGEIESAARIAGELAEEIGQFDKAAKAWQKAGELGRASKAFEQAGDYLRAADAARDAGDDERCAELLGRVGRHAEAAGMFERVGQPGEAVRHYEALEDHASVGRLRETLGEPLLAAEAWDRAGRPEQARRCLEKLRESDHEYCDGMILLGRILRETEGGHAAIKVLSPAITKLGLDVHSAPLVRLLSRAYEDVGELEAARAQLSRLIEEKLADSEDRRRLAGLQSGGPPRRPTTSRRRPSESGVRRGPGPSQSGVRRGPGPNQSGVRRGPGPNQSGARRGPGPKQSGVQRGPGPKQSGRRGPPPGQSGVRRKRPPSDDHPRPDPGRG